MHAKPHINLLFLWWICVFPGTGCKEEVPVDATGAHAGAGPENEVPLWKPQTGFRHGHPGMRDVVFVDEAIELDGDRVLPFGNGGSTHEIGAERKLDPPRSHHTTWVQSDGDGVKLRWQRGGGALSDWRIWLPNPIADGALIVLDDDRQGRFDVSRLTRGHTPFGLRRIWQVGTQFAIEGRGPALNDPHFEQGSGGDPSSGGIVPLEPTTHAASAGPPVQLTPLGPRASLQGPELPLFRPSKADLVVNQNGVFLLLSGECTSLSTDGIDGTVVQTGYIGVRACRRCWQIDLETGSPTDSGDCSPAYHQVIDADGVSFASPSPGEILPFLGNDGAAWGVGSLQHPDPNSASPDVLGQVVFDTLAALAGDPEVVKTTDAGLGGPAGYPWSPVAAQAHPGGVAVLTTVGTADAERGPFFGWAWIDQSGHVSGAHTATGGGHWTHGYAIAGESGVVRTRPDGVVERLLPTPEGVRVARMSRINLPENHALVSALPLDAERLLVVTWTGYRGFSPQFSLGTLDDPEEIFWDRAVRPDFGRVHLWTASRPANPPVDVPDPRFGVVAWPLGPNVAVCWPPTGATLDLDLSHWRLGGVEPAAIRAFADGHCATLVRGRDAGDLANSEVEGPIPGCGRLAIGVPTRVHREADFNGMPEHPALPENLNTLAPLATGGFRSLSHAYDPTFATRVPVPARNLYDATSTAVDGAGAGLWVIGQHRSRAGSNTLTLLGAPGPNAERVFDTQVPDFAVLLEGALVLGGGALLQLFELGIARVTPNGEIEAPTPFEGLVAAGIERVILATATGDLCGTTLEPNLLRCVSADGGDPVSLVWPAAQTNFRLRTWTATEVVVEADGAVAIFEVNTRELRDVWAIPALRSRLDALGVSRARNLRASAATGPDGALYLHFAEHTVSGGFDEGFSAGIARHTILRYDGTEATEIRAPQAALGARSLLHVADGLLIFDNDDPVLNPQHRFLVRAPLP